MILAAFRENVIIVKTAQLNLQPASGYKVIAFDVGAQVVSVAGADVTVRAGHGFEVDDKLIVGIDPTKYATVTAVTDTIISTSPSIVANAGDYLVNLGPDAGGLSPLYTNSRIVTYTDMEKTQVIPSSEVLTDSSGKYSYWHDSENIWELVRDAAGTPWGLILGVYGRPPRVIRSATAPADPRPGDEWIFDQGAGLADKFRKRLKKSDDTFDWIEVILA
ncbi:MAG: hypothetical protein A3K68_05055 [Euryarchaeota archaeon RBG_16_68_13]|nr:MAG: hypothetical protein A3K68_05055 [Euryarchaeota archaeon RBG_16_68_13]